ncbi:cheA signal transduction histidine kinase [Gloeomargarita lithophora Alchichica-D10]|uniref:histidine kinase n=1 Tax=Gloeomargarita lithophora Alchichica-D10 TaxID=1188229 RepID=A0A1J0A9F1_9CYAN|nr:response regulator [Gloeomargarita lithophora]APB32549.1 cheA signal transduction histidine kinase [Gloeomargarita lithophora Alchichica-D10]
MNFDTQTEQYQNILREVRQCFLTEDAPAYITTLVQGIGRQRRGQAVDMAALMRAAHSIKGGAGLSQLMDISHLAHQLEDLLQTLSIQTRPAHDPIWPVLERGIQELESLLAQAHHQTEVIANPEVLAALAHLTLTDTAATPTTSVPPSIVATALNEDLEACLTETAQALTQPGSDLTTVVENLVDACTLLGDTLDLPWLLTAVQPLAAQPPTEALIPQIEATLAQIRQQRSDYLNPTAPAPPEPEPALPDQPLTNVRLPLEQLESMANTVGELLIRHERLTLHQENLLQTSRTLNTLVSQSQPLREAIQSLYDQLAVNVTNPAPASEFDSLELDQYTQGHSQLQTLEETLLRTQEIRSDLELTLRELGEELTQVRQELDRLYQQITQSRLVPFRHLAQGFLPQLRRLNQQYHKQVELKITGEDVLVDQVLLERLRTPLTHLLNNAFDHGIESPAERTALDKPATAGIHLHSETQENQVVITLRDDGRGIDLQRVYQRAVQQGWCTRPWGQMGREAVLDFIFHPGFSTAGSVSALSGRGVGLDIVRTQIQHLRGVIQVETQPGQGTTFTLRLPRGLTLLPLLLCRSRNRTLGIPATGVLDILPITPGTHTLAWRGQELPVVSLLQALPYRRPSPPEPEPVGLVLGQTQPAVYTVGQLVGERQLILKSLDETVPLPPYLAGCTILGSGEVVPVLIPGELSPLLSRSADPPPAPASPASPPLILVAEDSVATRQLLERLLRQSGYQVQTGRDGQEAWEWLSQEYRPVGLVISDIEMPRLNGYGLLQRIRSHDRHYAVPVMMLTSRTGDRHRQKALSLGASHYLVKPIVPGELLSVVAELLAKTPAP